MKGTARFKQWRLGFLFLDSAVHTQPTGFLFVNRLHFPLRLNRLREWKKRQVFVRVIRSAVGLEPDSSSPARKSFVSCDSVTPRDYSPLAISLPCWPPAGSEPSSASHCRWLLPRLPPPSPAPSSGKRERGGKMSENREK